MGPPRHPVLPYLPPSACGHEQQSATAGTSALVPQQLGVSRDFPGGLVVKTLSPQHRGRGLIAGQGTKIPYAAGRGQE